LDRAIREPSALIRESDFLATTFSLISDPLTDVDEALEDTWPFERPSAPI
jgi:hypothetical protein